MAVRGTRLTALMHVADWYVTYCAFAKIDSADKPGELAGVPPVEVRKTTRNRENVEEIVA